MSDKQNDGCRFQLITFLLRRDKSASYCCCKPFKLVKNLAMLKCSREVINVSIVQQQIAPDNWYQSILLISLRCNGCYTSSCSPASSPWLLQPFLHPQAPLQASPPASAHLLCWAAAAPADPFSLQLTLHCSWLFGLWPHLIEEKANTQPSHNLLVLFLPVTSLCQSYKPHW